MAGVIFEEIDSANVSFLIHPLADFLSHTFLRFCGMHGHPDAGDSLPRTDGASGGY